MPRVVHFEIHAADPERAIAFYGGLFGWKFDKYPGPLDYWLITTGPTETPGINGGLVRRRGPGPDPAAPVPVTAFPCTVDVADIDKTLEALLKAGGTIALPKDAIPGLAWLAYGKDPDGNIFGVYQTDPNAKQERA